VKIFYVFKLTLGSFFSQLPHYSHLPSMPTTRQSTAVGAAKSAVEDNRLPPPAQPASKKAQVNRTTTSTPRKTRAGKKGSEAEERNRNVRSAEGSSAVLEPPVEPHSSDEADEAAGIPPNKSPIIVSKVFHH